MKLKSLFKYAFKLTFNFKNYYSHSQFKEHQNIQNYIEIER